MLKIKVKLFPGQNRLYEWTNFGPKKSCTSNFNKIKKEII